MKKKKVLLVLKQIGITLVGACLIGTGINLFYVPAGILGGGLTAISILLNAVVGTNIALTTFLFNIPALIAGYILVDRHFMVFSSIGLAALTVFLYFTANIPTPSDNLVTCIVIGAVLIGVGDGIMLRQNSSCAGLGILGRILFKYYAISMGDTSLIANALILSVSGYFLGLDAVVYAILGIFICGRVINYIVEGMDYKRTVIIISNIADEIALALTKEFGRGVTVTDVIGAYSGERRKQIMTVISPHQTPKLRDIVLKQDSCAFVTISESISVIGGGFKDNRLE